MKEGHPQQIKEALSSLRNVKSSLFTNEKEKLDFRVIVETSRIIDVSILPLFYIWEHLYHRKLSEVGAEKHLMKPYEKFSQDPIAYTWESYLFLKLGLPGQMSDGDRDKVLTVYESLFNSAKIENST